MAVRTFLALDLDEGTLDRLQQARQKLADTGARIRWVARENLHLTLVFLGDVPDETLNEVCTHSAAVAGGVEPFEFDVQGLRCVPPSGPVRMIWADVTDPTGRLALLHRELSAALAGLGLRQENRAFQPHITLARVKYVGQAARLRSLSAAFAETDFGLQHADELVTYSSQLTKDGPIYAPIARATLGR